MPEGVALPTLRVGKDKLNLTNNGVLYLYMGKYDESKKYFMKASQQSNYSPAQDNLKRLDYIKQPVKK